jgi:beta-glucosidase
VRDPWLNAVFGAAKVRGYQGDLGPGTLLACAKHYVAYGLAEGGRDYNTVDASEYRLRNGAVEPFRVAVEAGVASVMASFNTVAGRPMHANRRWLTEVLKTEWAHPGLVVGDADGVVQLVPHGVAATEADAVALALGAGLDVEMGGHVIASDGRAVVTEADVPLARIDDAVRRVLRLKYARGLMADPFVDASAEVRGPSLETLAAAREAARRCPVLLTNDGTLPVAPTASVLVVGPYAESTDHLGTWTQSFAARSGSLVDALRAAMPEGRITSLPGAQFFRRDPEAQAEAARAAREHDVVIVAVGEPSSLSGEASSRSDLTLTGDQADLIHAIAATGVPFAVVLVTGRPLIMSDWIDVAPSVLLAWHLGTQGPEAIADLLLGVVSPGGKLPVSIPRSVGQIPVTYDHENTGRPGAHPRSARARRDRCRGRGPGQHRRLLHLEVPRPRPRAAVRLRTRPELLDVRDLGPGHPYADRGCRDARHRRRAGHRDRHQHGRGHGRRGRAALRPRSRRESRPAGAPPAGDAARDSRARRDGGGRVHPRHARPSDSGATDRPPS